MVAILSLLALVVHIDASTNILWAQPAGDTTQYWHPRLASALVEAKLTKKNVFVFFNGYMCTNCRHMEKNLFTLADVKSQLNKFVLAKLYTDDGTPLNDSNLQIEQTRFNTIAVPLCAVISPTNKVLATIDGFIKDRTEFLAFLNHYVTKK